MFPNRSNIEHFADILENLGLDISHLSAHQISTLYHSIEDIIINQDNLTSSTHDLEVNHPISYNGLNHHLQPRVGISPSYGSNLDHVSQPNYHDQPSGYQIGDHVKVSQQSSEYTLKVVDYKWSEPTYIYHVKSDDGYYDQWIPQSQIISKI